MKEDGFNEAKDFIKNMVRDNYTISEPGTHVGIVEYSDEPSINLRLDEMFDENVINNLVDEMIPSEGESGNLDKALEKSVDKMFSVALGGRPSAKKILVVIAASNTTAKEALKKAAKPLKERGVRIYVIALDDADPEILSELVPDKTKIKKVKDKKKLPKLNEDLSELIEDDLIKSKLNLHWFAFFISSPLFIVDCFFFVSRVLSSSCFCSRVLASFIFESDLKTY
jgi:hypothetical protein